MTEHAITGTTQLVGLIGWPVSHSRSPRMHNAAFAALGLDWAYAVLAGAARSRSQAVRGLVALGFRCKRISVPHKQTVIAHPDAFTPVAARQVRSIRSPSVRTRPVRRHDRRPVVSSRTSGSRWVTPRRFDPGAGAPRAGVAYALAEPAWDVLVAARSVAKSPLYVKPRQRVAGTGGPAHRTRPAPRPASLQRGRDLVINATSPRLHRVRISPCRDPDVPFEPGQVMYDLVYTQVTPLMSPPRRARGRSEGLGMLVHQGALALTQWTGLPYRRHAAIED